MGTTQIIIVATAALKAIVLCTCTYYIIKTAKQAITCWRHQLKMGA